MSLQWELSREVPADTAEVVEPLLKPDNIYRQIGERFDELLPQESEFACMYQNTGRGAISPLLLGLVTVFQMLEKLPDRVATRFVVSRLDWKYALHLPLSYAGCHYSDLCAFRERLLEHGQERLLFDRFLKRLVELGLIQPRGKMRTDSTHVLAVVERLSQLELVQESLRVAVEAIAAVAPEWVEGHVSQAFLEAYESPVNEYGLSQAKVQARLKQVGRDGFWLLAQVERSAPAAVLELEEVANLRRVLGEQFPGGPGSPPAKKRPTGDVIESPHEPEARRGQKRGQAWTGYKVQVTETCDEDVPRLIVDLEPTSALEGDSPQVAAIQARLERQGTPAGEQLVDQGYMSGGNIAASAARGVELVGLPLEDTKGAVGFRQADFHLDEPARQAICPAGERSAVWSERQRRPGEPPSIQVRFCGQTCQACVHFGVCTQSRQGRSLTLHPYRQVLQARRQEASSEGYRHRLRLRAGVEGTISELTRAHGLRQARYRGLAKLRLQGLFTALAADLKRLARWWSAPQRPNRAPQSAASLPLLPVSLPRLGARALCLSLSGC